MIAVRRLTGRDADSKPGWEVRGKIRVLLLPDRAKLSL